MRLLAASGVCVAALTAAPAAARANSLLSGYGGPGAGEQVVIGQHTSSGGGRGGGGGGAGRGGGSAATTGSGGSSGAGGGIFVPQRAGAGGRGGRSHRGAGGPAGKTTGSQSSPSAPSLPIQQPSRPVGHAGEGSVLLPFDGGDAVVAALALAGLALVGAGIAVPPRHAGGPPEPSILLEATDASQSRW